MPTRDMHRHQLAWLTTQDIESARQERRIAVIPTGSIEQHGPHLPLGTDVLIAQEIAYAVADSMDTVLVAAPLNYGYSWHHMTYPGTASLRAPTFIRLTVDVGGSLASWALVSVFLNGHGGNKSPLHVAVGELAEVGVRAAAFTYFELLRDNVFDIVPDAAVSAGHAGALETSLVLHIWPDVLPACKIPISETPATWPDPHMFANQPVSVVRSFQEINSNGVIGRPQSTSEARGAQLFALDCERCHQVLADIHRKEEWWVRMN